jgi:hypothetical protein
MFNANELEKGKIWLMDSNVCVCGGGGGGVVLNSIWDKGCVGNNVHHTKLV